MHFSTTNYAIENRSSRDFSSKRISSTCAIREDTGETVCWGKADEPASADARYQTLAVGDHHECGVRVDDNIVECWGVNNYGQQDNVPTEAVSDPADLILAGDAE